MDEIMLDSSVWIAYFRGSDKALNIYMNQLLSAGRGAFCGIIEAELLQGVRKNEVAQLSDAVNLANYHELTRDDFQAAGDWSNRLKQAGTGAKLADCTIAALCLRKNIGLLTLDKDFKHFKGLRRFRP